MTASNVLEVEVIMSASVAFDQSVSRFVLRVHYLTSKIEGVKCVGKHQINLGSDPDEEVILYISARSRAT
jgi:hypothetical protein